MSEPLSMILNDGTTLEVSKKMELTIGGKTPSPQDVVDFIIAFARDSSKEPVEPDKALVDLVEKTRTKEEGEQKDES